MSVGQSMPALPNIYGLRLLFYVVVYCGETSPIVGIDDNQKPVIEAGTSLFVLSLSWEEKPIG